MSSQNNVLKDVAAGTQTFTVKASIEIIYGVSDQIYCFKNAKDSIKTVLFEPNSNLNNINQYAFYSCTQLSSIDLSSCSKLRIIGNNAFQSCTSLANIKLPEGLKQLGSYSLSLIPIQSINIPSTVDTIEIYCFSECTQLTTVTFSQNGKLTSIDSNIFIRCTAITSFEIPESVSYFSGLAFQYNTVMSSITVNPKNPYLVSDGTAVFSKNGRSLYRVVASLTDKYTVKDGVEIIESGCFMNSQLSTIILPKSVQQISSYAFYKSTLANIEIPDTVSEIGKQSFYGCRSLRSIQLPSYLRILRESLFAYSGLRSITIPDNVSRIDDKAFSNCGSLTIVTLPSSLKELGGGVISQSPAKLEFPPGSIYYLQNENLILDKKNLTIYQYVKNENTIEIPSTITRIKSSSFRDKTNLKSVTCNDVNSIEYIESYAFYGCTLLSSIPSFPSIKQINDYAFSQTKLAPSLNFSNSLNYVGPFAFAGCENLLSLTFSSTDKLNLTENCFAGCISINQLSFDCEGSVYIGDNAFNGLKSLSSLIIPNCIQSVGSYCFANCGIISVTFTGNSASFDDIPDGMFSGCIHLENIEMPPNIVNISIASFENTNISSFVFNDQITKIGDYCFRNCANLKDITIRSTSELSSIGFGAFEGCRSFSKISKFESNYFVVDGVALYTRDRTSMIVYPPASPAHFVSIPSDVKSISSSAFTGCINLQSVLIPDDSVHVIGRRAFYGCSNLHTINIPLCITTIHEEAFLGCNMLSCGLIIESKSIAFRKQLIDSGFPRKSLSDCGVITCKIPNSGQISYSFLFVFILI